MARYLDQQLVVVRDDLMALLNEVNEWRAKAQRAELANDGAIRRHPSGGAKN